MHPQLHCYRLENAQDVWRYTDIFLPASRGHESKLLEKWEVWSYYAVSKPQELTTAFRGGTDESNSFHLMFFTFFLFSIKTKTSITISHTFDHVALSVFQLQHLMKSMRAQENSTLEYLDDCDAVISRLVRLSFTFLGAISLPFIPLFQFIISYFSKNPQIRYRFT